MGIRHQIASSLARLRDWILLDVDRSVFAIGLLVVALAVFAVFEATGIISPERDVVPLIYLFSALAGGNVTLVTIVISINQLVLSRELRSPRELETELDAAEDYRDAVEDETGEAVIPEEPSDFLHVLVGNTYQQARRLGAETDADDASPSTDEIATLRSNLVDILERTVESIEGSESGVFPALSTILDADFSTCLNHSRWIRQIYGEELSDADAERLRDLEERLEYVDIARQYFKTVYIQQELANLSKKVTYSGLVAEMVALSFLLYPGYLGVVPTLYGQSFVVPLAATVSLAPLAILVVHVLRIATVAERTVAITPFLSPD